MGLELLGQLVQGESIVRLVEMADLGVIPRSRSAGLLTRLGAGAAVVRVTLVAP